MNNTFSPGDHQDKAIDIQANKDAAITLNSYFEDGWRFVEFINLSSDQKLVIIRKYNKQLDSQH